METFQEKMSVALRDLYSHYGYRRYKMSKFEEYDLYANNKDFLMSDHVITFTDLSGKLMALKPDVTLSIVKNSRQDTGTLQKVYYNENVYRVAKGSGTYKELLQVGLECLGSIDDYCILEVLTLAAESLKIISEDAILSISHFGILCDFLDSLSVSPEMKDALLSCIGQKNNHGMTCLCQEADVPEDKILLLQKLLNISGAPKQVLPEIIAILENTVDVQPLQQLYRVVRAMGNVAALLKFDFSVVDNARYYNGIVLKGFVRGIPDSILSGGQYDKLMRKLRRSSGAIGFAVYLDALERLEERVNDYDVDVLLLYGQDTSLEELRSQICRLSADGASVMVQQGVPKEIRCRQVVSLHGGEVNVIENNA